MKHAAITIQGILRDPVNAQPSPDGQDLYAALCSTHRVTLLADRGDQVVTGHWLKIEGFDQHTAVMHIEPGSTRFLQIKALRAQGPLDLVVTADPELAHPLFALGQPHLLYIQPRQYTSLPPRQEWATLVARIDDDRARAANVMIPMPADEEVQEE